MARWQDVLDSAPEFAAKVRTLFDARKHKTLATLRKDGSPRISGIECSGMASFGSARERDPVSRPTWTATLASRSTAPARTGKRSTGLARGSEGQRSRCARCSDRHVHQSCCHPHVKQWPKDDLVGRLAAPYPGSAPPGGAALLNRAGFVLVKPASWRTRLVDPAKDWSADAASAQRCLWKCPGTSQDA